MIHATALGLAASALACSRAGPAPASTRVEATGGEGTELLGTSPAEWEASHWPNSGPLTLSGLKGKVVLVRWWTANCPYCSATAPSLRDFNKEYAPLGLVVIGMYHHKEDGPLDPAVVDATAAKYAFTFPVAVDPDWHTLDRWWQPRTKKRPFTSVSFLLDRRGVIRHVHPGGEYTRGDRAYEEMQRAIARLLAEPSGDRAAGT